MTALPSCLLEAHHMNISVRQYESATVRIATQDGCDEPSTSFMTRDFQEADAGWQAAPVEKARINQIPEMINQAFSVLSNLSGTGSDAFVCPDGEGLAWLPRSSQRPLQAAWQRSAPAP